MQGGGDFTGHCEDSLWLQMKLEGSGDLCTQERHPVTLSIICFKNRLE